MALQILSVARLDHSKETRTANYLDPMMAQTRVWVARLGNSMD